MNLNKFFLFQSAKAVTLLLTTEKPVGHGDPSVIVVQDGPGFAGVLYGKQWPQRRKNVADTALCSAVTVSEKKVSVRDTPGRRLENI